MTNIPHVSGDGSLAATVARLVDVAGLFLVTTDGISVTPKVGSKTYDPGSIADKASTSTTVTVTDAAVGDYAVASLSTDALGLTVTAYVSATDTVTVVLGNLTGGAVDLASSTLRALVLARGTRSIAG